MIKLSELAFQPYAGIGSRETPKVILDLMENIAICLSNRHQMILRSGGANGADQAFQEGVSIADGEDEIYIPWDGFSDIWAANRGVLVKDKEIIRQSEEIAAQFHGGWNNLKQGARRLMARNTFQVLGGDLKTFSKFVICWTQDGADGKKIKTSRNTGGTGQAIRIAAHYNIPVINLFNDMEYFKWSEWVKG